MVLYNHMYNMQPDLMQEPIVVLLHPCYYAEWLIGKEAVRWHGVKLFPTA